MESKKEKVKAFIDLLFKSNSEQRLVLVTSGGTSVRLEKNTVRSIENFSTGKREHYVQKSSYIMIIMLSSYTERIHLNLS